MDHHSRLIDMNGSIYLFGPTESNCTIFNKYPIPCDNWITNTTYQVAANEPNSTVPEDGEDSSETSNMDKVVQFAVLGIVLGSLCLLTTVGNALVLYSVATEKKLQTVSNMFIVSLALADFIVGMFVMPMSAIYIFTEEWLFGVIVCQFWITTDYIASTASILNLFILSVDRYWSVTSPLKYIRRRTKKRAFLMISSAWIVSSLWIIPIVGWHYFTNGGVRTVPEKTCDTEYATNKILKIITSIFNFFLPLSIMYVLYGRIFNEIRKRSKFEFGQRIVGNNINVKTHTSSEDELNDETFSSDSSPFPRKRFAHERFNAGFKHSRNGNNNIKQIDTKKLDPNDTKRTSSKVVSTGKSDSEEHVTVTSEDNEDGNFTELTHSERPELSSEPKLFVVRFPKRTSSRRETPKRKESKLRKIFKNRLSLQVKKFQSSSLKKEIKAARQLGVIMGAFTMCFLPYFILFTVVAFCDSCVPNDLLTSMTWVGYLNSTLNPFLYPLCNMTFRRKFQKMLCGQEIGNHVGESARYFTTSFTKHVNNRFSRERPRRNPCDPASHLPLNSALGDRWNNTETT